MLKLKLITLLMIFASSLYAISLQELIEQAETNNLLIKKEILHKEQKSNEIETIKWYKNPKISFGFMENMSSQQITQGIKFPTKTYWAKKAKENSFSKAETKVDVIKRDIELKLSSLYYNLAFVEKKIELKLEKIAYLKSLEAVVRQMYIQGKTSQHHLIELKMKILLLEDELTSLKNKELYSLQLQINEMVDNKLDISEIKTENVQRKKDLSDFNSLYSKSLKNYPLFDLKQKNIEHSRLLLKQEKQVFFPDISFGLTREDNEMLHQTNYSFMLGFSLPLQFKANNAAIASKKNNLSEAKLDRRSSENKIKLKMQKLLSEYKDLEKKLDLFENSIIPLAKQNKKVATTAYKNETIDFKTYISTINDLIDKKLKYYQFERQFNQKTVEISNLTKSEENL